MNPNKTRMFVQTQPQFLDNMIGILTNLVDKADLQGRSICAVLNGELCYLKITSVKEGRDMDLREAKVEVDRSLQTVYVKYRKPTLIESGAPYMTRTLDEAFSDCLTGLELGVQNILICERGNEDYLQFLVNWLGAPEKLVRCK